MKIKKKTNQFVPKVQQLKHTDPVSHIDTEILSIVARKLAFLIHEYFAIVSSSCMTAAATGLFVYILTADR